VKSAPTTNIIPQSQTRQSLAASIPKYDAFAEELGGKRNRAEEAKTNENVANHRQLQIPTRKI
jgi:hypothetical protein